MDVIQYSISGIDAPWTNAIAAAFLQAFQAGIFVSATAGNAGPGPGTVHHTAPWMASTGAISHRRVIGYALDVTEPTGSALTGLVAVPGSGPGVTTDITAQLLDAATAAPAQPLGCSAMSPGPIFTGAIALIERGECTFLTKAQWAAMGGAVAVVIYNNAGGPPTAMGGVEGFTALPAVMVGRSDGLALVTEAAAGPTTAPGRAIATVRDPVAVVPRAHPHDDEIEALEALEDLVNDLGPVPAGISGRLRAMLGAARAALEDGNVASACGSLWALINHARAQSGRHLTEAEAAALIDGAEAVRAELGCR